MHQVFCVSVCGSVFFRIPYDLFVIWMLGEGQCSGPVHPKNAAAGFTKVLPSFDSVCLILSHRAMLGYHCLPYLARPHPSGPEALYGGLKDLRSTATFDERKEEEEEKKLFAFVCLSVRCSRCLIVHDSHYLKSFGGFFKNKIRCDGRH